MDQGLASRNKCRIQLDQGLVGRKKRWIQLDQGVPGQKKGWIQLDRGLAGRKKRWIQLDQGVVGRKKWLCKLAQGLVAPKRMGTIEDAIALNAMKRCKYARIIQPMTKIITSEDCGNSPKNIFLQDLTIAFAKRDADYLLSKVTDDFRWNRVGDAVIERKAALAEALKRMKDSPVAELTIHHVATHGKVGAINGTMKSEGGSYGFCDVVEFSNAKGVLVKEIMSYVIEVEIS